MDFTRHFRIERSWARRLTGLAMLLGVCASLIPLPVFSLQTGGKDRSQPYPCQNWPCGCRSAEQCWKKCCCFTNSQKVAWAKSQGVKVPEFVIAAARSEQPQKLAVTGGCEKCRKADRPLSLAGKSAKSRPTSKGDSTTQIVVIALMQKCQGSSWYWNALPWCTPFCPPEFSGPGLLPGAWEHAGSDVVVSIVVRPPVPPPRVAVAPFSAV